jgi:hypothetical protein
MNSKSVLVARGNTFAWKDQLREIGFTWLPEEKAWVFVNATDDSVVLSEVIGKCIVFYGISIFIEPFENWEKPLSKATTVKVSKPKQYWWQELD